MAGDETILYHWQIDQQGHVLSLYPIVTEGQWAFLSSYLLRGGGKGAQDQAAPGGYVRSGVPVSYLGS